MTTSNVKAVIQCDIEKVWETVSAVERYHTWRSDVSKTELTDEKHFTEYTKNGYSTTFTVTKVEPHRRWELDVENSHTKGHWTIVFASKGSDTQIDFTASAEAKQLSVRPVGKSVFEQTYLKKEQTQFVTDLKKALD
ncbi:MAG: SRPBCC family protein [Enterocloster asparagiformis]|nr:SRPBCC family protein [Enterocloster asparagiformis]